MTEYIDSGFNNSRPSITDWLYKWINTKKMQEFPNGWLMEKTILFQNNLWKGNEQLYTGSMSTHDEENPDHTDKRRNLLIVCMPQKISGRSGRSGYINQHILKEVKTKRKNLAMTCIDYKKGRWYGPIKLDYRISKNVQNIQPSHKLHRSCIKNWLVELTARGKILVEVKIQRNIFLGDALSPFVMTVLWGVYKLKNSWENINHFMRKDDMKLFVKTEKELGTLIQTINIYSQDIGMLMGSEKCSTLIMKNGNSKTTDIIRTLGEKENYKYLEILKWVPHTNESSL